MKTSSTPATPPSAPPPAGDALAATAPDAHARFRQVRFFSCLDGLRALSIVAVIWHHTAASAVLESFAFLHRGNRGVTLFFVISAFLISTLLLRAKEKGPIHVPRFLARRALRILPLYYAVLALYVVLALWGPADADARRRFFENLPAFATFTSNWFVSLDGRVIFYFAWSLAAEEQFYLCWPWIERKFPKAWPVAVAAVLLVVSTAAGLLLAGLPTHPLGLKIMASIPAAILLGVILAHVLNSRGGFARVWALAGRRGSALAALALTAAALCIEHRLGFFGELLTSGAMTLLVAACVVREDNDLAPLLRLRPVAWIGTVSYGVYLIHMLAVHVVRVALAQAGIVSAYADFVFGGLLAIGVATVSYLTFERFFLKLKDRWFSDARPAPASGPAAGEAYKPGLAPVR